jgi:Holliday junction resolvase RusA-like endonuclease
VSLPKLERPKFPLSYPGEWPMDIGEDQVLVHVVMEGDPVAHQRPVVTRRGTFTPKRTSDYMETLRWEIFAAYQEVKPVAGDGPIKRYGVQALFYRSNRQRIDIDNLMKTVMDAATAAGIWEDDSLVQEMASRVVLAQKEPRLELLIYWVPDLSPLPRCKGCGAEVKTDRRVYCSPECHSASKRVAVDCASCGESFERPQSQIKQKYCSRGCMFDGLRRRWANTPKESALWRCIYCGSQTSRKEYKRCHSCFVELQRGVPLKPVEVLT